MFGLIAAAVIGVAEHARFMPTERTIEVRVNGEGISRVELLWHEDEDIVHRTQLGPPFDAPAKSTVRLKDGAHELELAIHRGDDVERKKRTIEVADGAESIVIDVP